jgi:hypothetical protein
MLLLNVFGQFAIFWEIIKKKCYMYCTLAAWCYIKTLDVSRFCFCSCFSILGLKLLTLIAS